MNNDVPLEYPDNNASIFRNWMFRDFEGQLLTVLESFGLPDKQENAAKAQIRKTIWDLWHNNGMPVPKGKIDDEVFKLLGRDEKPKRK